MHQLCGAVQDDVSAVSQRCNGQGVGCLPNDGQLATRTIGLQHLHAITVLRQHQNARMHIRHRLPRMIRQEHGSLARPAAYHNTACAQGKSPHLVRMNELAMLVQHALAILEFGV